MLFVSSEALKKFIAESSFDDFKKELSLMSYFELAESFLHLQSQPIKKSQNKLNALFKFIDLPTSLENFGKHLSVAHFIKILEFLEQNSLKNRLSFIFTGLTPQVFSQALLFIKDNHLEFIKQENLLEPLQYHMTQFFHEGELIQQQVEQNITLFIQQLNTIEPDKLTPESLNVLINQIDRFRDQFLDYLKRMIPALSIVWKTERIDLIEKLSSINEAIQFQLSHTIGHPPFDLFPPKGLYLMLQQTLSAIFDSALKDDDAAIEGLAQLSIWHLKDYWDLGLLPFIHQRKELDKAVDQYSEKDYLIHHQKLFLIVQQQLKRLNIETVGKLKKNHLFSKSLLEDYIRHHRPLLNDKENSQ